MNKAERIVEKKFYVEYYDDDNFKYEEISWVFKSKEEAKEFFEHYNLRVTNVEQVASFSAKGFVGQEYRVRVTTPKGRVSYI